MPKTELKFEFDNEEAAKHFAVWLCESGEQTYWLWMEFREEEEPGPITVTEFHYHGPPDQEAREFLEDGIIRATCGRLTGEY